jgi:Endoplasmic reticulum-based factor for assembly of V-ATPase.
MWHEGLCPAPPKKPEPVRVKFDIPMFRAALTKQQSPEYLASKARLLAAQEKAAYERLLNPTFIPNPNDADRYTATSDKSITEDTLTPSLVFNIFISVLVTGFSTYWALTKFTMPNILARMFSSATGPRTDIFSEEQATGGASAAVKVLLSLFAALTVAIAESFLYVAYVGKIERAQAQERKFKERKTVVGEVQDSGQVGNTEEREGVEIWGKGVNGGVRRRVREKYEKEKEQS